MRGEERDSSHTFLLIFIKSYGEEAEKTDQRGAARGNSGCGASKCEHDVRFGPTDFGLTLSVVIKPEGGGKSAVSVTDCEVVSRPLSKELDDLMEDFPHNYLFEVTSVGISEDEEVSLDEQ